MEKEAIESVKNTFKKDETIITANIKGMTIWFGGDEFEDVTDSMIEFAIDLVNDYQSNKDKYDNAAIEAVVNALDGEQVDNQVILDQIDTPIVDVVNENAANLLYNGVEEIGDHMPEVRLNRDLSVYDVVLNG